MYFTPAPLRYPACDVPVWHVRLIQIEVVEIISAYKEEGLPPCAFAAAVPNNWERLVSDLVQSVWKDHQAMVREADQAQGGGPMFDYLPHCCHTCKDKDTD